MKTEVVPEFKTVIEEDESNPGNYIPVESTIMVPAFAVVARDTEAMIVVRGTQSMADWTININMVPETSHTTKGRMVLVSRQGTCWHDQGCSGNHQLVRCWPDG